VGQKKEPDLDGFLESGNMIKYLNARGGFVKFHPPSNKLRKDSAPKGANKGWAFTHRRRKKSTTTYHPPPKTIRMKVTLN
tara:strand:+ start:562 stop:801 length:240 start_codon:yes stop_codon:yes gene_type:complete